MPVRHWLMFADRVNMVEGIADDLMSGHVPNFFAEMGLKAEWKYNRAGMIRKMAISTAIVRLGFYLMKRRNGTASARR